MAYRYPNDDELRKVNLNPDMIRHEVREDARHDLTARLLMGIPVMIFSPGFVAIFCATFPWHSGTFALVYGILLAVLLGSGIVFGILTVASAIRDHRRAMQGEITIEIDTVTYIEHDRPRTVCHRGHRHIVYEDFLHFKSGREFKDAKQKYRHLNIDDETFVTAAYAADRETILRIYRLVDYNWQE